MIVNGAPIRRKAKRDYEKALRDIGKARQELETFEKVDKPEFQQWLSRHFGAELTRIRELSSQLAVKRQLVIEIEAEVFYSGSSYYEAYRRVNHRQEEEAAAQEAGGQAGSEDPDPFHSQDREQEPEQEFFKEFFDFFENQDPDSGGFGSKGGARSARTRPEPASPSPRMKELYRALVRLLHPDRQSGVSQEKLERWHEVQKAYQKGDAEQLEVLLSLCEIEEKGTTEQTSVSLLSRITHRLKSTLRSIRKQLNAFRRDPAWGFSARADKVDLKRRVEGEIQEQLNELHYLLEMATAQLQQWSQRSRRRRRRDPGWSEVFF